MKKMLFIFLLITIASTASYGNVNMALMAKGKASFEIQKDDSIIGDWVISRSIWTEIKHERGKVIKIESAIVANVCTTITFKKDGKGVLKKPKGSSSFNWLVCNDRIYFSFDKKEDEKEFFSLDKEFRFKIYDDSKFHYLELIQKKEGSKYVLIRSLNR